MKDINCLSDLKPNQKAVVEKINADKGMHRRLLDIGLTPGTEVKCVGKSPLNDPSAYLIRGAVIALREKDAKGGAVRKEEG